jgi:homoserine O-acetyltransferase
MTDHQVFEAGDVALQSGAVFPGMRLAYRTYGTLSPAKDNAILYPTSFAAQHQEIDWLVQPDGAARSRSATSSSSPNLFGNGLSSSPSNAPGYAPVTYHDAVAVQRRLLVERISASRGIALVYGWSMGGMQAYHWAAGHADMVERVGRGLRQRALLALQPRLPRGREGRAHRRSRLPGRPLRDPAGDGTARHGPRLCRLGPVARLLPRRALARGRLHLRSRTFLVNAPGTRPSRSRDADDLLAQIAIWQAGDISACAAFGGDMDDALAAVRGTSPADAREHRPLLRPGATTRPTCRSW